MRVVLLSLALWLGGLASPSAAQCLPAGAYYAAPSADYARYGAYYAPYAPQATYAPFSGRPTYPMWSNTPPATRLGVQSTYFRGQPGPAAPPGGTFFGGYDYQVTYPPGWFGGYWTRW